MHGLGRTWPNYVGWAPPSPCEQWRAGRDEAGETKGKKGRPAVVAVVGRAAGVDRQRRWWFAAAGDAAPSSSSLLYFLLFYLFLLLSFFWSSLSLLFSLSLFFSSLPSSLPLLSRFFFSSPVFYKQKQGRDMARAATVLLPLHHPSNTWKVSFWQVGLVGVFLKGSRCLFEGRDGGDRGRKIFFFPCFARPGEEENPQCRQNGTVSVPSLYFSFFFVNSAWKGTVLDKMRHFI